MKHYTDLLEMLKKSETMSVKIKSKELVPFIKFLNKKRYYEKLYISTMSGDYIELKKTPNGI